MTEFSYARYLAAKRTVDDRALNRHVFERVRSELERRSSPPRILELGAGLGTMIARLESWGALSDADYTCVDADQALAAASREWLCAWATSRGYQAEAHGDVLRIRGRETDLQIRFVEAELAQYLERTPLAADLVIANAVLDLVDVPALLPFLYRASAPDGLFWFSINYDGETTFIPELPQDALFLRVYNRSMDERVRFGRKAGDSKTGRHLFQHLRDSGAVLLAAGASDWVVHANGEDHGYGADEAYFLGCIIDTVDAELRQHPEIDAEALAAWVEERRRQLETGELVFIAHQLDFVGRAGTPRAGGSAR